MMQGVANCAKLGGNTMGKRIELADDSQIAAARAVGESGMQAPRAVAARYLPARDRVEIDLASGWSVRVSRSFSARLATASVHDCERNLDKIKARIDAGKLSGQDAIGVRVGRLINQYKVAKHFELSITDAALSWARRADSIASEAALDGLYIVRTSVPAAQMDAPECVRSYKSLAHVERAFRSMKTIDLKVRPIHHRLENRVRAHIFLCMLAYYVEWHLREAWRELMFADTEQQAKASRDPVAPATRSAAAQTKAATHALVDGTPAHSFAILMAELATLVRNTCRAPNVGAHAPTFELTTAAEPMHQRAFALVQTIKP